MDNNPWDDTALIKAYDKALEGAHQLSLKVRLQATPSLYMYTSAYFSSSGSFLPYLLFLRPPHPRPLTRLAALLRLLGTLEMNAGAGGVRTG